MSEMNQADPLQKLTWRRCFAIGGISIAIMGCLYVFTSVVTLIFPNLSIADTEPSGWSVILLIVLCFVGEGVIHSSDSFNDYQRIGATLLFLAIMYIWLIEFDGFTLLIEAFGPQ